MKNLEQLIQKDWNKLIKEEVVSGILTLRLDEALCQKNKKHDIIIMYVRDVEGSCHHNGQGHLDVTNDPI